MRNAAKSALSSLLLVFLIASCSTDKAAKKADLKKADEVISKVTGKVTDVQGNRVKDAYVYAYKSAEKGQMGPSDFISNPTNEKGEFSLTVTPGEYLIIARKRTDGSNVGVLSTGDYSSPTGAKMTIAKNSEKSINLTVEKIVEPMFFKMTGAQKTNTGIKGSILDEKGAPVAGAFAIAYKNAEMKTLPDFASAPTLSDGSYVLYLPKAGEYYIAARVNTKKPPVKGEYYGTYNENEEHLIKVQDDKFIDGINITLKPFEGEAKTKFKGFD